MTLASGTILAAFGAYDCHFPSANGMHPNQINSTATLEVTATEAAASTDIIAVFQSKMPDVYGGEALDVVIEHSNSGTTNNCLFSAELERRQSGAALASDNFATLTDGSATAVPGTANNLQVYTIASVTLPASFTGKDLFRLRIKRRLSQAGDTNAGQTDIHQVTVQVH